MFGFLYSVAGYLAFFGSFGYFLFFTNGWLVPKTVDSGEPAGVAYSVAVNLALVLLFGVQHSVMARASFKAQLTKLIPAHLERATYVWASSAALALICVGWQPLPAYIFHVEAPTARTLLWALNLMGWMGVPLASFLIDHFDLFGLKQPFAAWRKKSFESKGFVMPWLYRHCRHPMMTALMLAMWATPDLTVGHALLATMMSGYILVGVHFEERALRRELGAAYARYQETTPKFLPRVRPTSEAELEAAPAE